MDFTASQRAVVECLQECRVAAKPEVCRGLNVAPITFLRALGKYGYYSSYNHNGAYYTLRDTPVFDENGLWLYGDIGFSRHGSLTETLRALIARAPAGATVLELEALLRAHVANQLCRLRSAGQIGGVQMGRNVVYVCADAPQAARQETRRRESLAPPPEPAPPGALLAGVDAPVQLSVLVEMIRRPEASVAALSRTLQSRGVQVSAEQIRLMIGFYRLGKKTAGSK